MKSFFYKLFPSFCLVCAFVTLLAMQLGCGGGGGGGGSGNADVGNSFMTVEPATLEVGGVQKVSIELSDVTESLIVKVRYPDSLLYVPTSGRFQSEQDNVGTNPAFDDSENPVSSSSSSSSTGSSSSGSSSSEAPTPTAAPTATATAAPTSASGSSSSQVAYEKRYLVFFLTSDAFREGEKGLLSFNLRARSVIDAGQIELDVDLDDPSVDNEEEFSVTSPSFEAEQARGIRVRN